MPPTEAVVVDPGPVMLGLGLLSVSERVSLEARVDASAPSTTTTTRPTAPLAGTGLNVTGLVLTACALILVGALFFLRSRRIAHRGTK